MTKKVKETKETEVEKSSVNVDAILDRIKKLNETRELIEAKKAEISTHQRDVDVIAKLKGADSDDWKIKNEILKTATDELDKLDKELGKLSFKKSELKPVLDDVVKKFETKLYEEQEHEYHLEIGTKDEKTGKTNGGKVFRQLLKYIQNEVEWTAQTATGLMMLERNMSENKPWVQSKEFDGVIILRSANVLVLYKSVLSEMHGKGAFAAREFIACWANCGKSITDAVNTIQKSHEETRVLGTKLNTIEEEFNRSEDDLPKTEAKPTTKDEVAPDVD